MSPDKGKSSRGSRTAKPAPRAAVKPAASSGSSYVVRWHPAADAERDASWPADEKVAMFHAVEKLQALGPRLGNPHSSAVRGEAGKGFPSCAHAPGEAAGGPSTGR
jgi:hypothetical protein